MKIVWVMLKVLCVFLLAVSVSHAVTCARGVYRAGCVGPNGAVVKTRPPAVVVAPKPVVVVPPRVQCAWVNGHKVCR